MTFYQEPLYYEKTILSDLKCAWELLNSAVLAEHAGTDCSQLLLHIDAAMSWESVRDLEHMQKTLVLIQSIAQQQQLSEYSSGLIAQVRDMLNATLSAVKAGSAP